MNDEDCVNIKCALKSYIETMRNQADRDDAHPESREFFRREAASAQATLDRFNANLRSLLAADLVESGQ
jgi:hypothetical protein